MTIPEIRETSRLKLHPLRIARFGDGNYSVIRRGGRKEIATRGLGIEALERLKAGDSIGEACRWLAEHHATEPVNINIKPLLVSLMNAGMIAAVDGVKVDGPRIRMRDYLGFQLRFEAFPRAVRLTRRLPVAMARPLLRRLYGHDLVRACREKVGRAGASYEAVFPREGRSRQAFEEEYLEHLIWNVVDLEALRGRPFDQMDTWLDSSVHLEGRDLFEWALRQGQGVMLVGLHISSNRLLPVTLMRHGYSLASMGAINIAWGPQRTKDWIADWRKGRPGYGQLEFVDNLDMTSVNTLIGTLRRGGTVLTMPDVYSLSTFEDAAVAERSRFLGVVRSQFPRSSVPVRFFDHWIDVNPWGGWLAARARPILMPVFMERRSKDELVCRFGEPFEPSREGGDSKVRMAEMTQGIFRGLEREVARIPAQWFGWHNLDKWNPRQIQAVEDPIEGAAPQAQIERR